MASVEISLLSEAELWLTSVKPVTCEGSVTGVVFSEGKAVAVSVVVEESVRSATVVSGESVVGSAENWTVVEDSVSVGGEVETEMDEGRFPVVNSGDGVVATDSSLDEVNRVVNSLN